MRALPHLLQRLRRWWSAHLLRIRAQQLDGLIGQVEQSIRADHDELTTLRSERSLVRAQIAALEHARSWRPPSGAQRWN